MADSTTRSSPAALDTVPGSELTSPTAIPDIALWGQAEGGLLLGREQAQDQSSGFSETMMLPPTLPSDPEGIGQIGRYTLKYPIGEGGLGSVYAANDPLLSRLIAIKTLNLSLDPAQRETFNSLFLAEARAAAGLSHPHIVTVFDAGISDNKAYIAMELLKGRDLRQLRGDGWRPSPAQAALIVRRVADALSYAHHKGVIHRDVKPANIFMVGRTQPRVLDFGIARVVRPSDSAIDSSQSGDEPAAGSPYYMSPEQARQETVDRRSDVFSLGVVLYELLTDRKPFTGSNLEEITDKVLHHEPPMAHRVDDNVPESLSEIVARAMEKDPEKRTRSARAFSHELRQWLEENAKEDAAENTFPTAQITMPRPGEPGQTRGSRRAVGAKAEPSAAGNPSVSRGLVLTGAVAMAMVAFAAAWMILRKAPETLPEAQPPIAIASPPVATSPSPASQAAAPHSGWVDVTDAASSRESQAATGPNEGVPTPQSQVAEVKLAGRSARETAREKKARESVTAPPPAPVAAAPGAGFLKIAVSPWGNVEVDGRPVGTSPPLTEIKLTEGKHQITIRNDDFPPFSSTVHVAPNEVVNIRHKFGS